MGRPRPICASPHSTPLLPALARPCVYFRMAVRRKEEFYATLQAHKVSPFLCAAAWERSAGMPIQAADAAQRSYGTVLHLPDGLPRCCFLPAFRHTGSPRPGLTRTPISSVSLRGKRPGKRQLAHGADGISNDVPPPIVAVLVSTASLCVSSSCGSQFPIGRAPALPCLSIATDR